MKNEQKIGGFGGRGRGSPKCITLKTQSSFTVKSTIQDIFISADVDEVLSRGVLHQLKWCQVKEDVITGEPFEIHSILC